MSDPEEMIAEAKISEADPLWDLAEELFNDNCVERCNSTCEGCKSEGMVYEDIEYPDGYYCKDCMIDVQFQVVLDNE